jgi:D-glycero-D-manno-heptose 1,7-bisphosphate phosphatase
LKTKLLLLDRDGVINKEIGNYITSPEQFELLPGIIPVIQGANQKNIPVVVITNQGGLAKGLYSHEVLQQIHLKMTTLLGEHQCTIDRIIYCPHHPEFNGNCLCRKPQSQMLEKALAWFKTPAEAAVFIGDHQRDLDAANRIGVRGILIPSNHPEIAQPIWGEW